MMEEEGFTPFTVIFNLILQYVRSGQVNNWEKISNEYTEFLYGVSDVLDEAVAEDDIKKRLGAVNLILVKLWGYMKEEIEIEKHNWIHHGAAGLCSVIFAACECTRNIVQS